MFSDAITSYFECPVCHLKREIRILVYEDRQYWQCKEGEHVLVMDQRGRQVLAIETRDYTPRNWRVSIDRKRETDYNPKGQAWIDVYGDTRQRRKGGRKGKAHYNFYTKKE